VKILTVADQQAPAFALWIAWVLAIYLQSVTVEEKSEVALTKK
jgi:hypothetical protein